ncbi:hypothetical protein RJ639_019495 [Escallonia herrerae]|uniref:Glutathione S-transferase C-terminal domain-containing protein n=1 Tax=Escallonia herrerae TaxID=1293975 RepID=A0AA88VBH1_9ASTE|nr:hypothetical protein RJ639_019495 [Escallonia herrerae]
MTLPMVKLQLFQRGYLRHSGFGRGERRSASHTNARNTKIMGMDLDFSEFFRKWKRLPNYFRGKIRFAIAPNSEFEEPEEKENGWCAPSGKKAKQVAEEQDKAAKEARENLKTLESALEGKRFFGSEAISFADIAIGWMEI